MGLGLKACGCCDVPVPCVRTHLEEGSLNGTNRNDIGNETELWQSVGELQTDGGTEYQYAHPLRYGGEIGIGQTVAFRAWEFPPAAFRHFTGSEVELTVTAMLFHFAGRASTGPGVGWDYWESIGQPYGDALRLNAGTPSCNVTASQMMHSPTPGVWNPLQPIQQRNESFFYYRHPTLPPTPNASPRGTTIVSTVTVPVTTVQGTAIGADVWMELVPFSAAILADNDANRVDPLYPNMYRRWIPAWQSYWYNPQSFRPSSMCEIAIEGLSYCPTLDRTKDTWRLDANSIPTSPFTVWSGGLNPSHTFGPLADCTQTEFRTTQNPVNPSSFAKVVSERWTVHWGQPWPEVQHVVGLYDPLQVKITHSTLFYRPTGWDGVSATEFFPHSTANISDVGGFGGPVVPWTGTDRIPDFHRSPQTSGGWHPGSFTLSRVPL